MFSNINAAPMMETIEAAIHLGQNPDVFFAAWGSAVFATLFVCGAGFTATYCGYSDGFCEGLAKAAIRTSVVALSFTVVQIHHDTKRKPEVVSQKPTSLVKHPGPNVIIPIPRSKPNQQQTPFAEQHRSHETTDQPPQPDAAAGAQTEIEDDATFEVDEDDIDWSEDLG